MGEVIPIRPAPPEHSIVINAEAEGYYCLWKIDDKPFWKYTAKDGDDIRFFFDFIVRNHFDTGAPLSGK